MKTSRHKVQQWWSRRRLKLALSVFLALVVSSVLQLEEVQPRVMSRNSFPDGIDGKIDLSGFASKAAMSNQFVKLEFLSALTDSTRSKSHSTLLHIGQTEATGIRLDLGQSDVSGVFSYYLVVGSGFDANGYQVKEFPLTESDLGDARISLFISNEAYEFSAYTSSGRVLRSQGKSAPIDFRQIYLGGGPPGLVPGFTDIRLHPSETFNSSIKVEQGVYRSTSQFGLPERALLLVNMTFNILLGVVSALTVVFLFAKKQLLSVAFRKTMEANLDSLLLTICVGLWVAVIFAWWVQAAYRDVPVTRNFSAQVYDSHCDPKTQGVG